MQPFINHDISPRRMIQLAIHTLSCAPNRRVPYLWHCEKLLYRLLVVVIYAAADDAPVNIVPQEPFHVKMPLIISTRSPYHSLTIPQYLPFDLIHLLGTPLQRTHPTVSTHSLTVFMRSRKYEVSLL